MRYSLSLAPALFGGLGLVFATLACTPEDDGGDAPVADSCDIPGSCPASVSGVDLETAITYKEVFSQVIQKDCAASSCHGSEDYAAADLYLGPTSGELSDAEAEAIVDYLINDASRFQPKKDGADVPLVDPGNWENSFFMLKVDGCQNAMGLECDPVRNLGSGCEESCGDGMPQEFPREGSPETYPLSEDSRHLLRRWIQTGAAAL